MGELKTLKDLKEGCGRIECDRCRDGTRTDDKELIKEARNTYLKFKRIHKNCIPKLKVKEVIDKLIDPSFPWVNNYVITREDYLNLKKEIGLE